MKGIILAGGTGSRLFPLTKIVSKQLLPIYNKQMIFYPLETLRDSGIQEVLFICDRKNIDKYKELLGNGSELGLSLSYVIQERPEGLPQAFILGEDFIGEDDVALILGDNIFGSSFKEEVLSFKKGAKIIAKYVKDPERFGVVEFDSANKVISLEEKPINPKSNFAIPGFYLFDNRVVGFAKALSPSKRGELEIIDIQKKYFEIGELEASEMKGEWVDAGTFESLVDANLWAMERVKNTKSIDVDSVAVLISLAFEDVPFLKQVIERLMQEKNIVHLVIAHQASCDISAILKMTAGFPGSVQTILVQEKFSSGRAFAEGLLFIRTLNVKYTFLIEGHTQPEDGAIATLLESIQRLPNDKAILVCNRPNVVGAADIFYQEPGNISLRPTSMFQGVSFNRISRFFSAAINRHFVLKKNQFIPIVPIESFSYTGVLLPMDAIRKVPAPDMAIHYGGNLEYSWNIRKAGYMIYVCYDPKLYDLNPKEIVENTPVHFFSNKVPLTTVYLKMSDMVRISRRNSNQNTVTLFLLIIMWVFFLSILGLIRKGFNYRFLRTVTSLVRGVINGYKS